MTFRERAAAMRSRVQQWRGEAARYTPAEGDAVTCTAVIRMMDYTADLGGFPVQQTGRFAILLTSDIAARPTKGATVEMLDAAGAVTATYTIAENAVSEDSDRLEWRCRVGDPVVP